MEEKLEKWLWFGLSAVLCIGLIVVAQSAFIGMFPDLRENAFWIQLYLAFILSATFHYREDVARLRITILFIVLPISFMFLLSWVFKDAPGIYGRLLKINFPRSVLTAGAVCFLYYTFYIRPSDTLKQARLKKKKDDEKK
jgi:hypothetical protein